MFRNDHYKRLEHVNIYFDCGGVGDYFASMPAVKYIRDNCPNVVIHLWCPDYFVPVAKHLVPNIIVTPFSEKHKWKKEFATVKLSNIQHTSMGTHLTDYAFNVFADKQVSIEYKNYCKLNLQKISIKKFNLPEKYVVLCTGFTAPVREMVPKEANEIIKYCKQKGYEVITLGSHIAKVGTGEDLKGNFRPEIDFHNTMDLINKTSLLEAGKVIAGAKVIVGLDNGLLHLAGCTDVPIVAGFTTVKPEHRLPYRNNELGWNCYTVVPDEDLECRFCQSTMIHVYDNDFRFCYYGDRKCVEQVTSNKYIEQLEKIL